MLTDVTLLIPRAASRTPSPSCGSTFPGIRKTPGVTLPHPQRLKWLCWRNVKCSFTNEDEKSSLYPAQHGGTNMVSISYDKSAASGNHAPASPFRSHSTQTRAPTAGRWDGRWDDNTATAGKQWFQNCDPRGGRGASLFQTASLLTYSSAKWTVAKPLHYPEWSGMPHKSAGAQERGKKI